MPASEDMPQPSTVLIVIGGVEIGDESDGSGDWGLSLLSYCRVFRVFGCSTAIVAKILDGLIARFK